MAGLDSFHEKLKGWLRRTLSCCRDDEEEEWKPVIGKPFDFRREDVCIAGLSSAEQEGLRIRAVTDANRMFATLQPLHNTSSPLSGSSPSSPNPAPPPPPPPRPAHPSTLASAAAAAAPASPTPRLDRVKAHTRALSNSLETAIASVTAPTGYSSLPTTAQSPLLNASESAAFLSKDCGGAGTPYEMRQLLSQGAGSTGGGGTGDGKGRLGLSSGGGGGGGRGGASERRVDDGAETTWAGCEEDGDGDSGKGMMGGGYVRTR